jgi:hypothetical protein
MFKRFVLVAGLLQASVATPQTASVVTASEAAASQHPCQDEQSDAILHHFSGHEHNGNRIPRGHFLYFSLGKRDAPKYGHAWRETRFPFLSIT